MNNISVLTDFEALTNTSNFKYIESPAGLEDYSICLAGNFIFVSNKQKNRTIRFSLANLAAKDITPGVINEWIERIQKLYPAF
ncbi:MAG: hypothetical protein J0I84_24980 [Terrimonas sp.]|uniref:hypothetical protein n=1 Tax=Terrimonas sp. TaxID=1914338 RepID=UPI00092B4662|nr:hypothetical protein [Terrimonas sp.]MBN8790350.1 hypothetical protein [Terrimonas sp.]OJY81399.1 MAG: hypothetical protein BGP13_15510 [Sphingobacteriales bacterium 40-81]PVD51470.1 hypothetical protein DC498_15170 [Terrimonas sp.]